MSKPSPDRDKIGSLLLGVARLWRRAADRALDDCGLSHATAMPLVVLSRLGGSVRQGVVADHLGLEGPSLVRIVDLLLADGLITRREDPADRRAKVVSLTAAGQGRATEIETILEVLRTDLLKEADDTELRSTIALLERLEAKLIGQEPQDD